MKPEEFFIYLGFAIIGILVFGLIIRWAVRADSIVNHQLAMIAFPIKLCRQHDVTEDEIESLKNMFRLK